MKSVPVVPHMNETKFPIIVGHVTFNRSNSYLSTFRYNNEVWVINLNSSCVISYGWVTRLTCWRLWFSASCRLQPLQRPTQRSSGRLWLGRTSCGGTVLDRAVLCEEWFALSWISCHVIRYHSSLLMNRLLTTQHRHLYMVFMLKKIL